MDVLVIGEDHLKCSISEGEGGLEEVSVIEGEEEIGVDGLEGMQIDRRGELHRDLVLEQLFRYAEELKLDSALVEAHASGCAILH